jgi:hypothetical protein
MRIVDGREAVTFLVRVKEVLEDPANFDLRKWLPNASESHGVTRILKRREPSFSFLGLC